MSGSVEIKVCGLTDPVQAAACAAAGADAIGVVFHPASPRHVTAEQARAIAAALPPGVPAVAVYAGDDADALLAFAAAAGVRAVQWHAPATPGLLARLQARGLRVVQRLDASGDALRRAAAALPPSVGVLVECGRGILPGGNGVCWAWEGASPLRGARPFAIAGGLHPGNVAAALAASGADAVDASSGLESAPGIKDLARVRDFVAAVRACPRAAPAHAVFAAPPGRERD